MLAGKPFLQALAEAPPLLAPVPQACLGFGRYPHCVHLHTAITCSVCISSWWVPRVYISTSSSNMEASYNSLRPQASQCGPPYLSYSHKVLFLNEVKFRDSNDQNRFPGIFLEKYSSTHLKHPIKTSPGTQRTGCFSSQLTS